MGKSKELAELGDVVTQDGGNMLVGTTGHFNYSGGTTEITVGTGGTGSSAGGAVTFVSNNGATTLGYAGFQESEAQIGTMGSRPLKLTTNNTARMTIDASGRVTMPYQPAFHAMGSSQNNISSGNLIYSGVTFNTGNHYNATTGVFTAPVAGVYQFHASCYSQSGTGIAVSAKIAVNGVMRQVGEVAEVGGNFSWDGINMSVIVSLSANDQVAVQFRAGPGQLHLNANNNSFSGALIG